MTERERQWPDLAGRLDGDRHILPIRVYFEDTDFSGLVYHASYLRFIERGRSDFLRLKGVHHHELISPGGSSEPAAFVVRRMQLDYLQPASIDDALEVVTEVAEMTSATLTLGQQVLRQGVSIFRAEVMVVLVSRSGRPLRLPARLREAFARRGGA